MCAPFIEQVAQKLHIAFQSVQTVLMSLKLVLNGGKTKLWENNLQLLDDFFLAQRVPSYKYLGIWIDNKLLFHLHIARLGSSKWELASISEINPVFTLFYNIYLQSQEKTCGSYFFICHWLQWYFKYAYSLLHLWSLDSVYHASLCFITKKRSLTHHCILYELVGWTSPTTRRQQHWYIFYL